MKKIVLIVLFSISINCVSQSISTDQIKEYVEGINKDLPFALPGSGGIIVKNATSFGRNMIWTYEVPENWFPAENAKEQVLNNLSDDQKKIFSKEKINLIYNFSRDNSIIFSVNIPYSDLGLPDVMSLGDYISYKNHPKAKGVNIKIKNPLAFEKLEGNRPNIVAKYNYSDEGLIYMLQIIEFPTFLAREDVRNNIFQGDSDILANELISELGGNLISSRFTNVDRYPALEFIYDVDREMAGQKISMRNIWWNIYYEDRIINLSGGTFKTKFEKNKYIFYNITNSVLFEEQYNYPGSQKIYNNNDFLEFVDKFYRDINFYGINKVRPREINISLKPLDTFKDTYHFHGVSLGFNDESKIDIIINERSWNSFTKAQKHYLIYHELSHDVLNLDDLTENANQKNIMYPSIHNFKDLTMDDFIVNFRLLLEDYYENNRY